MTSSNTLQHRAYIGSITAADANAIDIAAGLLLAGAIAAVPTETVYGLAADASNPDAVAAIYRTKGRPDFNPLIVHVPGIAAARQIGVLDERAEALAAAFWPGPLTLVLPLQPGANVTAAVTAGLSPIALRCPAHPVMQALLKACGLNLAAPSANRSGGISPTCAQHVAASLREAAPMILDGGPCSAGLESTIIALRPEGWQILREGPVTRGALIAVLNSEPIAVTDTKIEAPGQMASHYAPTKPIRLNAYAARQGEYLIGFGSIHGHDNLSPLSDLNEAAARLFDALHRADASDARAIAVAPIPATDIGAAIHDRLNRAAAGSGA
jgi:L-threonylcarbamoyladenylate synthase